MALAVLMTAASAAHAQEIEPRAYSNAPIGVNFLIAGYAQSRGGLAFDGSVPITDPNLTVSSAILAFARIFEIGGQSAKFDVVVPFGDLDGTALNRGQPVQRDVGGLIDPKVRLSVNLYGAPALSLKEFASFQQDLIIGASVQVSAPAGQYDNTRLVNLGTNRWYVKPELGISKAVGRWTAEGAAAVTLYTDNKDFLQGGTRSQDPLYSIQGHLIYNFRSGVWGSVDVTYYAGGRTTLNGVVGSDLQQNWRVGATLAFPVNLHNSIKLYASSGVSARTGNDYDLLGIAWQYRWGGGL